MTRKPVLIISIDCECDKSSDWTSSNPLTFDSITDGIPNRLQPVFDQFRAIPTYLLSNEVLEDQKSVKTLKALTGKFELGAHLHSDYIRPKQVYHNYAGTLTLKYQCEFPKNIEKQKMLNLTELFKNAFGYSPSSFRAGRFGAGKNTIRILESLDYKVDSSVHPGLKITTQNEEINYTKTPIFPYFTDIDDLTAKGKSTVLEVPVTLYRHPVLQRFFPFINIINRETFIEKALCKIFPSTVLRPTYHTAAEMIRASRKLIHKSNSSPVFLNMMFHSMEIIPGASPYAKNPEQANRIVHRIKDYLQWWDKSGYSYSSLGDTITYFNRT